MLISPEKHIYLRLVSTPSVARHVGFGVYPIAVPKTNAALPFLIYKRANILREPSLVGPIFAPVVNLQLACWAASYDGVRILADEVRLCLDGHTGDLGGCRIQDMRLTSEVDDFIDPIEVGAQLPPAYEVRQLYQVRWSEATG